MTLTAYLWCNVVWCPTESVGGVTVLDVLFAHPEVGDFDVTFRVQHDIVQF